VKDILYKLYFKLYFRFKHVPCRGQVMAHLDFKPPTNELVRSVAQMYTQGLDVKDIAFSKRIPRERVRQLLISVVR
jgi:hypothetical protein